MSEKSTEQKLVKAVKVKGGLAPKFVSPGFDGVPDRIVLLPFGKIAFIAQLANGAIYGNDGKIISVHDKKLDALEDLIEAANGKPVLVAYWFKHDLERIKKHFDVREIKTSRDIADWNNGDIPVAVIHPASAGHGLNLQSGGSTLIWFGVTWSLELYQQTNARLWRQGQKSKTVVIYHIITEKTIDEKIIAALGRKDKTQSALIDAVKANLEV